MEREVSTSRRLSRDRGQSPRRTISGDQGGTPRRKLSRSPAGAPAIPVSGSYSPRESSIRERETQLTGASEGTALPLAYGRAKVAGDLFLVGKHGSGDLVLAYVFSLASNGLGAQTSKLINGDSPSALLATLNFYDGLQTAVDASISGAYGTSHPETYRGVSYASLRFGADSRIFGSLPEVHVLGYWRKVWDPRGAGSWVASSNPALIALDVLRSVDAGGIADSQLNLQSFGDVADFCDQSVSGFPRYKAGGVLRLNASPVAEANRILAIFGGGITYDANGLISAWMRRDDIDASGEIAANTEVLGEGAQVEAQLEFTPAFERPARIGCKYLDPDRSEEQILWWVNPAFQVGVSVAGEQIIDGSFISDPITAVRLAHDAGLALVVAPLKAKARVLDAFPVGSVWRFDPYGAAPNAAACTASAPWTATGAGSGSVPGTILNVSASFRLDSGSGTLVEKGTAPDGFAVSVARNLVTVRLLGTSYALPAVIPYGVPVSLEILWRASDGKLLLYQHGELISQATTSGISSVSTTAGYRVGAFDGALEWVLCGGVYDLAQARYRSAWNSTPPGSWDLYFLRGQYYRGTGDAPETASFAPAFWVTRCDPQQDGSFFIELDQWRVRSRAGAVAESTGSITVARYDAKPALSQVQPDYSPPPVQNLALSVIEDTSVQPHALKIRASWFLPNYPYIRGARVSVDDGTGEKTLGTFGRGAREVVFPVFRVGQQHTVSVYVTDNFGNESSGLQASITPGPANFGVAVTADSHLYSDMPVKRASSHGIVIWQVQRYLRLYLSVTNPSAIDRIEIEVDGVVAGSVSPSTSMVEIIYGTPTAPASSSSPITREGNLVASFKAGSTVKAKAIGTNGNVVVASTTVPSASEDTMSRWGTTAGVVPWVDANGMLCTYLGNAPATFAGWTNLLQVPHWDGNIMKFKRIIFQAVTPTSSPATYSVSSGSWTFIVAPATGQTTATWTTTSTSVTISNGQGQTFNIFGLEA